MKLDFLFWICFLKRFTPNRIPNRSIAHVDGNVKILQTTININESQLIEEYETWK